MKCWLCLLDNKPTWHNLEDIRKDIQLVMMYEIANEFEFEFEFWCLTPLLAIFQLYHGDQF
jgi:hypothetical protein